MKLYALFLLNALTALTVVGWDTDFCDPSLCDGVVHVGCKAKKKFSRNCPSDAEMVVIGSKEKELILKEMNKHRNFIAGGGDRNHKPACSMATIQWDKELAYLAEINVKQCALAYDCHNTAKFKYAGQTIAYWNDWTLDSLEIMILKLIRIWYDEVENSTMEIIEAIPKGYEGPFIDDFTILIAEKNTHVGCAASRYSNGPLKTILFTCNFAVNNVWNNAVYEDCPKPGIMCKTGTNPNYPNLCSTSERYAVNQWIPVDMGRKPFDAEFIADFSPEVAP